MKTLLRFVLMIFFLGCSASVALVEAPRDDASTQDGSLDVSETTPSDSSVPDRSDAATLDDSASDASAPRLIASVNPMSPPDRTIPPNATGVQAVFWNVTTPGERVQSTAMHVRHVGVGPVSDIANIYLFAVPRSSVARTPFRYSAGRAFDPRTGEATFNKDVGGILDHSTATWILIVDFRNATPGAQHTFELTAMDTDQETIVFSGVRSHTITIGTELATRLDVQRGTDLFPVHANEENAIIASMRLVNGVHESGLHMLSLYQGGSVQLFRGVSNLRLWMDGQQIPIVEWMDPFNGYLVLVPTVDLHMRSNSFVDVTIRGDVHTNPGETFFFYFEYPADITATDLALNTPTAVCISPTATGGCTAPSEGSLDGSSADNAIIVPVIP